jgi:hypothetical protein
LFAQVRVDSLKNVEIGSTSNLYESKVLIEDLKSPSNSSLIHTTALEVRQNSTVSGAKRGVISNISGDGTGDKYGYLNYIIENSGTPNARNTRGLYTRIDATGAGNLFGIYNYFPSTNTNRGVKTGIYNVLSETNMSGTQYSSTNYGIQNMIYSANNSNAKYKGFYTWMSGSPNNSSTGIEVFVNKNSSYSGGTIGVLSEAFSAGGTGSVFGVYGIGDSGSSGTTKSYGLYGTTQGSYPDSAWAGFFDGDYYYSGSWKASDLNLKRDVVEMDRGVEIIKALRPVTYYFRDDINGGDRLSNRKQYGFISQEVETILPEIVRDITVPGELIYKTFTERVGDDLKGYEELERKEVVGMEEGSRRKVMDYEAIIPILVKAVQEQQSTIEELKQRIEILENR